MGSRRSPLRISFTQSRVIALYRHGKGLNDDPAGWLNKCYIFVECTMIAIGSVPHCKAANHFTCYANAVIILTMITFFLAFGWQKQTLNTKVFSRS